VQILMNQIYLKNIYLLLLSLLNFVYKEIKLFKNLIKYEDLLEI